MNLIGRYSNPGYASVADAVREFFERRVDLQRPGVCLLYTSPSPRDLSTSRMPSSA